MVLGLLTGQSSWSGALWREVEHRPLMKRNRRGLSFTIAAERSDSAGEMGPPYVSSTEPVQLGEV